MSGSIDLYISKKSGVHKIPKPKYSIYTYTTTYRAVPSLVNEDVLHVTLCYETLNRKPYELDIVSFERFKLDDNGGFERSQREVSKSIPNYTNYAFSTVDSLSLRDTIPIPVAPKNIPTDIEKNALYLYVKENYPHLWVNCPYLVEQYIKGIEEEYNELKNLVKEAYKKKFKCS